MSNNQESKRGDIIPSQASPPNQKCPPCQSCLNCTTNCKTYTTDFLNNNLKTCYNYAKKESNKGIQENMRKCLTNKLNEPTTSTRAN